MEELLHFYKNPKRRNADMYIKQSHRDIFPIKSESDIIELKPLLRFPLVAETKYEVKSSPICHFVIWKGRQEHLFTVNQLLSQAHHVGNEVPNKLTGKALKSIIDYTHKAIAQVPDFVGIYGIDYIITPEDEIFAVDFNPRFCSSTYPFYFLLRCGITLNQVHARYHVLRKHIKNISTIFSDPNFVPFDCKQGYGILLFNPVIDFTMEDVHRFSYLAVASNKKQLEELEQIVDEIVCRVQIK